MPHPCLRSIRRSLVLVTTTVLLGAFGCSEDLRVTVSDPDASGSDAGPRAPDASGDAAADATGRPRDAATRDGGSDPDAGRVDAPPPPPPACSPGETRGCYAGALEHAGVGACAMGIETCVAELDLATGTPEVRWSECAGWVAPSSERCGDGIDDDCDRSVDEGCAPACWPTGNALCWVGGCGGGYGECWGGGCADPPMGNCCSGHYSTSHAGPDGSYTERGYNRCD